MRENAFSMAERWPVKFFAAPGEVVGSGKRGEACWTGGALCELLHLPHLASKMPVTGNKYGAQVTRGRNWS
jgi:hypothetical protein